MLHTTQGVTACSISTYKRIVAMLRKRAIRRQSVSGTVLAPGTATALAIEFNYAEPEVSEASARLYRAAVVWEIDVGCYSVDDIETALALLNREPGPEEQIRQDEIASARRDRKRLHRRGAEQKARSISLGDTLLFLDALRSRSGECGTVAADWFAATLVTGLRPCEWKTATLDDDHLVVVNAKATHGRSHGQHRRIFLAALDPAERECINRHLAVVAEANRSGSFPRLYHSCRNTIRRTADRLWPERQTHPTLYTARHAFCSAAKRTWSPEVVAALMGHASTHSAAQYYASGRLAFKDIAVEPAWDDVLAVRARKAFIDLAQIAGSRQS